MTRRPNDPEPAVCFICHRAAGANGYVPAKGRNQPIAWVCNDPTCHSVLRDAYHMPVRELTALEAYSLADAGAQAGAYLESIGKTDLGDLDQAEWSRFLKIVLTSYGTAMRERLLGRSA